MSLFEDSVYQLQKAAEVIGVSPEQVKLFTVPEREFKVSVPVKMDDGSLKIFEGFRMQHNANLGPYKGGIRYHPQVSDDEVKTLAFWMMVKNCRGWCAFWGREGRY